jgi:aspartyl/glutamyl-tRNA(Asn/Gln) amidotransferase C subunit
LTRAVRHHLARIKVSGQEASSLQRELTAILKWVEHLGEVDTSAVELMLASRAWGCRCATTP